MTLAKDFLVDPFQDPDTFLKMNEDGRISIKYLDEGEIGDDNTKFEEKKE